MSDNSINPIFDLEAIRNGVKATEFHADTMQQTGESATPIPTLLERLHETSKRLTENAAREIVYAPALISREGVPIVRRGTLVGIQGRTGTHKSRLAETFAALMLANDSATNSHYLGFCKAGGEKFAVAYIDTERNQIEEFPAAIQRIRQLAGQSPYRVGNVSFEYTSIKDVPRTERLEAIQAYLTHLRESTPLHIVCILDVLTDCMSDFNEVGESLALCDFLNNLCESQNVTIFGVIHENPSGEKARGHIGTEFANKASAFFQLQITQDGNSSDTDTIRLRCLKVRGAQRPEPMYLVYCEDSSGLILAPSDYAETHKGKTSAADILEVLESVLSSTPMPKKVLYDAIKQATGQSQNTIAKHLKAITESHRDGARVLIDKEGNSCTLRVEIQQGKNTLYSLTKLPA